MAYTNYRRKLFERDSKEPFKLSRSKVDLFIQCPACFYLDRRLGVTRPSMPAFTLNTAVDHLLKKEFDIHRKQKSPHPLMESYGLSAIPFAHPELDNWRENFKGIQVVHKPTNLLLTGAIDDLWQNARGELIVVDYKATSKDKEIVDLDPEGGWHDGYRRQMEFYQWLLRQNGFDVSNTGYFVYANGKKDAEAFDGKLEFDINLIPYTGDSSWVEPTLKDIKKCLELDSIPPSNPNCEYCVYRKDLESAFNLSLETTTQGQTNTKKTLIKTKAKQALNLRNGRGKLKPKLSKEKVIKIKKKNNAEQTTTLF